jgi:hypothetical protein
MTDADNGGENEGGFAVGERWPEDRSRAADSPAGPGLLAGSRTGNWIRTVCFMFWSAVFAGVGGGKSMRTLSLFGSFGPAMEGNKSVVELIDQKSQACH